MLAWMKWKQLTGVLFDKNLAINLKYRVYNYTTVIKPTMTYGAVMIIVISPCHSPVLLCER